jgi:phosphoesterase RecJ-like protein
VDTDLATLKQLILGAQTILITSHIGPDGDSVSSSLLLYQILRLNYPDKEIAIVMEEAPYGLDFLAGYNEIQFIPFAQALESSQPELVVVLDASTVKRVTRNAEPAQNYLAAHKPKLAIIDHHEKVGIDDNDVYINNDSPAVTLDVYKIFLEELNLKKPDNYAQTAITGIYTDTGGFIHKSPNFKQVFDVVPKLIADGADLELTVNNLNMISQGGLRVLEELIANVNFKDNFTYTYISDETSSKATHPDLIRATEAFRSEYLRNIEGRPWGFIVYRDLMAADSIYSVSFRSLSDGKDVSEFAARLGGGGHKPAAGAKFEAPNVQEALTKVLGAIAETEAS